MSATTIGASAGALVEQIGSYAGLASMIGLGVLALLYFAQAREVKRLRDWVAHAPERDAELARRVQSDVQRRVASQPLAPMTAAAQGSAPARAHPATAAVLASVGGPTVGAPAPIPAAAHPPGAPPPPGQLARPAAPIPAAPAAGSAPAPGTLPVAPAPAASTAPPAPAAPTATPPTPTPTPVPTPTPTPSPTPTPAPIGRPIVTATPPATPSATTAAARVAAQSRTIAVPANGSMNQDTAESAAARPEPLPLPLSPPMSRYTQEVDDDDGGFSRARVGMIVGGGVVAVLVAVVLMVVLTGDDNTEPPPNGFGNAQPVEESPSASGTAAGASGSGSGSSSGASPSASALTSAARRATDIAVLNGTTQTGLARAVANKIQEDGYTIVGVDTNADQSVPATVVSYSGDNQKAALAVARIMGVDRGSVQAADANTTAAATADVTVIVGSDQIE